MLFMKLLAEDGEAIHLSENQHKDLNIDDGIDRAYKEDLREADEDFDFPKKDKTTLDFL